ncbi:MAG TPA: hypothetical protein VFO77_14820, partial [Actinoplanes sp.]|nr:hypothetical protein [Actinoplanes sp.]
MPVAGSRARQLAGAVRRSCRRLAGRLRDAVPTRLPAWAPAGAASGTASPAGRPHPTEFVVDSADALPGVLVGTAAQETTRQLRVVVERWRAPLPGWSGRLGPLPHLIRHELVLPERGTGRAEVAVELAVPLPLPRVVAAVIAALRPEVALPRPVGVTPAVPVTVLGWLGTTDVDHGGDPANAAVVRPYDLALTGESAETPVAPPARATATVAGLRAPGAAATVLVDARGANPYGRRRYGGQLPRGLLHVIKADPVAPGAAQWRIDRVPSGPTVVAGRTGDPLQQRHRSVLAELGLITGAAVGPGVPPDEHAAVLAQLAMTGAPMHVADLPGAVAALLDDELAALLAAPAPGADPLEWELRSVAQRRAALRGHATGFGLGRVAAAAYPSLRRPPAVSALLVTRRPHLVRQA